MFNAESARVAARAMSEATTREQADRKPAATPKPRRVRQLSAHGIRVLARAPPSARPPARPVRVTSPP
jgi:hypothetical protein